MSILVSQIARLINKILFSDANYLICLARVRTIEADDSIIMPESLSVYDEKSKNRLINPNIIDWSNGKSIYLSHFKAASSVMWKSVILQIINLFLLFSS